jgi:hypothetical protein
MGPIANATERNPRQSVRSLPSVLQAAGGKLTYRTLVNLWRKGLRNGNWSRLELTDRALVRCALWVARIRGSISNMRLMVQVLSVVLRLLQGCRSRILDAGNRRVRAMLQEYAKSRNGISSWVPQLKEWFLDPRYVWYLGVLEINH